MNRLGRVIRYYRDLQGISRFELANGICSEKYVYLVEKEERNPSSIMTEQFGERLGVNLFAYLPYQDCEEPVMVKEAAELFIRYRRNYDWEHLRELTNRVSDKPDFREAPWRYEIEFSNCMEMLFRGEHLERLDARLLELVDSKDFSGLSQMFRCRFLLLLAMTRFGRGESESALQYAILVKGIVSYQKANSRFYDLVIGTGLIFMCIYLQLGDYDKAKEYCEETNRFQRETDHWTWSVFTVFGLAICSYKTQNLEQAFRYFEKGMHIVFGTDHHLEMDHLKKFDSFRELLILHQATCDLKSNVESNNCSIC